MTEDADFAIIGTGAGPYFRPLEDFASDEAAQTRLYWTDDRICDGADWPLDWREMWRYHAEDEQTLGISGPVSYPWGPASPWPTKRMRWACRSPG
jgi:hypothetical protein